MKSQFVKVIRVIVVLMFVVSLGSQGNTSQSVYGAPQVAAQIPPLEDVVLHDNRLDLLVGTGANRRDTGSAGGPTQATGAFAQNPPRVGEPVEAWIDILNQSNHRVVIKRLIVGARGPGGANLDWNTAPNVDFPAITDLVLEPYQMYEYRESRTFSTPGNYFAEPVYQKENGEWVGLNPYPRVYFRVQASTQPTAVPQPTPTPAKPTGPANFPWITDCSSNQPCPPANLTVSDLPKEWQDRVIAAANTWNNVGTEFQFRVANLTENDRAHKETKWGINVGYREVRVVQASDLDQVYLNNDLKDFLRVDLARPATGATFNPLQYNGSNGRAYTAGGLVVLNDLRYQWWTSSEDTWHPGQFDLQTVALHELGHALGMNGHSEQSDAVMGLNLAIDAWPGEVGNLWLGKPLRNLQPNDIQRIKSIYRTVSRGMDFPQTGKTVSGRFLDIWSGGRSYDDSMYINGVPISDARNEVSPTDGKSYLTQWFERARLEFHPENQPPYDVLLGLLGADAVKSRKNETPFKPVPRPGMASNFGVASRFEMFGSVNSSSSVQAGTPWFQETQHTLGDNSEGGRAIAAYWNNLGGLAQFGFPLSQPFMERNKDDGKTYLVQYFERQRFEYHPENKGTRYEVLLGRLGAEQKDATPQTSGQVLSGHSIEIGDLAFSPDGKLLASGSNDVRLWRMPDGGLIRTLNHGTGAGRITFSPDGQILASMSGRDKTIRLWRVSDGSPIRVISTGNDFLFDVAFSPDGQMIAAGVEKSVRLWRVSDGSLLRILDASSGMANHIAFTPDGRSIISALQDRTIRMWSLQDGKEIRNSSPQNRDEDVHSIAYSPDGQTLALGLRFGSIELWRASDFGKFRVIQPHKFGAGSIAFSPDSQLIASVGENSSSDREVKLSRVSDGTVIKTLWTARFQDHIQILSLAFSPDGNTIAMGSTDTNIRLLPIK